MAILTIFTDAARNENGPLSHTEIPVLNLANLVWTQEKEINKTVFEGIFLSKIVCVKFDIPSCFDVTIAITQPGFFKGIHILKQQKWH